MGVKPDHRKSPPRRLEGLYCPPNARFQLTYEPGPWSHPYEKIAPKVDTLPAFLREHLLQEFDRRQPLQWLGEATESAPEWLRRQTDRLVRRKVNVAFDADRTSERAERIAVLSRKEKTFHLIKRLATHCALTMPAGNKDSTEETIAKRCYEAKVWRRLIDVSQTREAENCLREIGFIQRRDQLYCTNLALSWFRGKMRAQVEYLKSHAVESGGEQLNLFEVQQRSVSNPAIRRAELMTRMSGFEAIAKEAGHAAEFITLTTPSKFHATLSTGEPNPLYDGSSVREGQAWLSKMWTRSRSKLARLSILVYGFRIAEPHHDGTPHWHMVLFARKSDLGSLRTVLSGYWLSECGSEPGALSHRITFQSIDPLKGSATGYISKYVAKNIDGYEVGADFEALPELDRIRESANQTGGGRSDGGETKADPSQSAGPSNSATTVARVRAWASLHGIRQFQQIGGPTVTLYRELRRCRDAVDVAPIERARVPADAGDWAGYVASVGGIEAGRATSISLWKEITGECNAYGELRSSDIVGITAPMVGRIATRTQTWRVIRILSESSLGPVSITVRDGLSLANPHGWTNPNETSMYGPN